MHAPGRRQHIRSAAMLLATLLVVAIMVLPSLRGLSGSLVSWQLQHETLHAVVETLGCMMALGIAGFLLLHKTRRPDHQSWLVCSMLVTGVLDAFHASMPLDRESVFVRGTAQVAGGLCVALMWLPKRLVRPRVAAGLPKILAAAAALLAVTALAFPQMLPSMLVADRLAPFARTLNSLGGLLFLAGAIHLALHFRCDRDKTRILFIAYCLLFAVAGLNAGLPATWAAGWWLLHMARLGAYAVAFKHIPANAAADYARLVRTEESLRRARDTAEEANKAKDRFLANISHDIRTPLNAIIGFSEAMATSNSVEQGCSSAKTILRESEHLLFLINEILDHAKLDAGRIELVCRPLNVRSLTEDVIDSARGLASDKDLQLSLSADPDLPSYVMADAQRLRQILMNLVGNAVKFTEKGFVDVSIESRTIDDTHADLEFSITDTGIGITQDKQASIFESFTQAEDTTTRRFDGTGLGTTISKQLVELMGGRIGLSSKPGHGSTFWFSIPARLCDAPPQNERPDLPSDALGLPSEGSPGCAHILVAEDYPPSQDVARMHLESAGHTVEIACDGLQAVEKCTAGSYDLIFMDVQMPRRDGLDATRLIRSAGSPCHKTPIVGLTANADETTRLACFEAGMNDIVTKPVRRHALLAATLKWLATPGPGAETCEVRSDTHTGGDITAREDGDSPIDFDEAVREFGGDRDLVSGLIDKFLANVESQITTLTEAIENEDHEILRQEAHKIRGGAANLAAQPLALVAEKLEDLAQAKQIDEMAEQLGVLTNEFDRLKTSAVQHGYAGNPKQENEE